MSEWLVSGLLLAGALLMFTAAVGVLRMPDLFTRMQASTKAGTLGSGLVLLAVAIEMRSLAVTASAALIIGFLFLTAPVAAHIIARVAHRTGVRTWEGTVIDELRQQGLEADSRLDFSSRRGEGPP